MNVEIGKLLKVLMLQLNVASGVRGGEIMSNVEKDMVKVKQFAVNKPFIEPVTGKQSLPSITLKLRSKTNLNEDQLNEHIIGATNNSIINPYKLMQIYVQRRKKLAQYYKNKSAKASSNFHKQRWYKLYSAIKMSSNNKLFVYGDGSPWKTKNFGEILNKINAIMEVPDNERVTHHSVRIGLATIMSIRGFSDSIIRQYIGWKDPDKKHSSQEGYVRLDRFKKANLLNDVVNKKSMFE